MKKFISIILVLALCVSCGSLAFAAPVGSAAIPSYDYTQRGVEIIEQANAQIEREILKAQNSTDPNTARVIAQLVIRCAVITRLAQARAYFYGVTSECVYVTVVKRGIEVEVDPLKIINIEKRP